MSTRSVIARPTETGFTGRYHHWDGYPSGLGATLFALAQPTSAFGGDTERMLHLLIDEHPAGWSTINGHDMTMAPGFGGSGPECYCHGGRNEEGWDCTEQNAAGSGCEWAYVIRGRQMVVLSSYTTIGDEDEKMIGFFGMGDENAEWRTIAVVDLDAPEPDWEKMQGWPS